MKSSKTSIWLYLGFRRSWLLFHLMHSIFSNFNVSPFHLQNLWIDFIWIFLPIFIDNFIHLFAGGFKVKHMSHQNLLKDIFRCNVPLKLSQVLIASNVRFWVWWHHHISILISFNIHSFIMLNLLFYLLNSLFNIFLIKFCFFI